MRYLYALLALLVLACADTTAPDVRPDLTTGPLKVTPFVVFSDSGLWVGASWWGYNDGLGAIDSTRFGRSSTTAPDAYHYAPGYGGFRDSILTPYAAPGVLMKGIVCVAQVRDGVASACVSGITMRNWSAYAPAAP